MKNTLLWFAILSQTALANWYNSLDDLFEVFKQIFTNEEIDARLPIKINSSGSRNIKDFQNFILPPWTIAYENITEFYEKREILYRYMATESSYQLRALAHYPDYIDGKYYLKGPAPISDWLECPPSTRCYLSVVYSKKTKNWKEYQNAEAVAQNHTWSKLQPSYENNMISVNYTFHGPRVAQLLLNKLKYKITWKIPSEYRSFLSEGSSEKKSYIMDLDDVASMYTLPGFLGAKEVDATTFKSNTESD